MAKSVTFGEAYDSGCRATLAYILGPATCLLVVGIALLVAYHAFARSNPLTAAYDKHAEIAPAPLAALAPTANDTPRKNTVISLTELRTDVIAYYDTLITILVALLGGTAIVGFVHLRHVSREETEHKAYQAAEACFELQKTHRLLEGLIADKVEEYIQDENVITCRLGILEGYVEDLRQYSPLPDTIPDEGETE